MKNRFLTAAMMLLTMCMCGLSAGEVFFADGKTNWKICNTDPRNRTLQYAEEELGYALKKISGAAFETARNADGKNLIVLSVDPKLGEDEISVRTADSNLYLSGGAPRSVLYAVYSFLRKELGVRYLWPGESGEFMPEKRAWELPRINYTHTPPLKYRGFHTCGAWFVPGLNDLRTWMARNCINIHRHGSGDRDRTQGFYVMRSSHNAYVEKKYFKDHPDWFALVNGGRIPDAPCYSQPEVKKMILDRFRSELQKYDADILSMMAPDVFDYCRCEMCAKKTPSALWFDFYNEITDELKKEFPKVKFATIAYQWYDKVPENGVRNSEFVEICTYPRCNIHLYEDDTCPCNKNATALMETWRKTGLPLGNYGYEFDLSMKDRLMLPYISFAADTIRNEVRLGHKSFITEIDLGPRTGPASATGYMKNRLALYLYAEMMWDPEQNLDALLKDYCRTVFGKAADPMFRYYKLLDRQWTGMKGHRRILLDARNFAQDFITPDFVKEVKALFKEVSALYGSEKNENFEYEKKLLDDWVNLIDTSDSIILRKFKDEFPADAVSVPGLSAKAAWNGRELVFSGVKPPFKVELNAGFSGVTWIFALNESGEKSAVRISEVGVPDTFWKPEWTAGNGTLRIPFKSLDVRPEENEKWSVRIEEAGKKYPLSGSSAPLVFSSVEDRTLNVAVCMGKPQTDAAWTRCKAGGTYTDSKANWRVTACDNSDIAAQTPDIYFFTNPTGPEKLTDENWKVIRTKIAVGATAVFSSYRTFPLDEYLEDPTFAVTTKPIRKLSIANRRTKWLRKGQWLTSPLPIENRLWNASVTPAYCTDPADPEQWTVLAKMPVAQDADGSFIMARRYGKGFVIVISFVPSGFQAWELINNIHKNRESIFAE